jgi:hypothetical protein
MVSQNVAEIIQKHVTLEVESIDRMYLNGYVPGLQTEGGFVHFVRKHLGYPIASTAVISPLSKAFVQAIEAFAKQQVDVVTFGKHQRKDDVTSYQRLFGSHPFYRRGVVQWQGTGKSSRFQDDS